MGTTPAPVCPITTARHATSLRVLARSIAVIVGLLATAQGASATGCLWSGSGSDNRWSTASNWITCNNTHPQNGDDVFFPEGAAQPVNTNDISGLVLRSLSFQIRPDGTGTWTID